MVFLLYSVALLTGTEHGLSITTRSLSRWIILIGWSKTGVSCLLSFVFFVYSHVRKENISRKIILLNFKSKKIYTNTKPFRFRLIIYFFFFSNKMLCLSFGKVFVQAIVENIIFMANGKRTSIRIPIRKFISMITRTTFIHNNFK